MPSERLAGTHPTRLARRSGRIGTGRKSQRLHGHRRIGSGTGTEAVTHGREPRHPTPTHPDPSWSVERAPPGIPDGSRLLDPGTGDRRRRPLELRRRRLGGPRVAPMRTREGGRGKAHRARRHPLLPGPAALAPPGHRVPVEGTPVPPRRRAPVGEDPARPPLRVPGVGTPVRRPLRVLGEEAPVRRRRPLPEAEDDQGEARSHGVGRGLAEGRRLPEGGRDPGPDTP